MLRTSFFIEIPIHYTMRNDTILEDFRRHMTACETHPHIKVGVAVQPVKDAADRRVLEITSHSKTRVDDAKNVFQSVSEFLATHSGYFDLDHDGVLFPAVTHELCRKTPAACTRK